MLADKIVAGACSGIVFWLYALPVDTIKTRIEADKGFMAEKSHIGLWGRIMTTVKKQGGVVSLYKALPIALLRGVPGAVVTLTTYDVLFDIMTREKSFN